MNIKASGWGLESVMVLKLDEHNGGVMNNPDKIPPLASQDRTTCWPKEISRPARKGGRARA